MSLQQQVLLKQWAESFLFAGGSAFLLLIARLVPSLWFLSCIALLPFLYRMYYSNPNEAFLAGFLFGSSFFSVSFLHTVEDFQLVAFSKILLGAMVLSAFGASSSWMKKRWGLNPLLLAILWVIVELTIVRLGLSGGLLIVPPMVAPSSPVHGIAMVFGFLIISGIIILLNSFLVLTIEKVLSSRRDAQSELAQYEALYYLLREMQRLFTRLLYNVPSERGPPLLKVPASFVLTH